MSTPELGDALVGRLRENWRGHLGVRGSAPGQSTVTDDGVEVQVAEFQAGRAASFPYFTSQDGEVTWLTVARNADDLRREIEDLRAWLMPSYAVEVRFASPSGAPSGELGRLALEVSPCGYWVWKCPWPLAATVAERMRLRIRVNASRPARLAVEAPSLYELRLRFRAALVAGDRDQAAEAIEAIDADALDGASNVTFMRIRMWDRFGEHDFVEDEELVRRVVRLRAPSAVRLALVRAVHTHHLHELEEAGQNEAAEEVTATLLDWLARELVRGGWSMKALHRLIVTSQTYRQSSVETKAHVELDPQNVYLARQRRLRLGARSRLEPSSWTARAICWRWQAMRWKPAPIPPPMPRYWLCARQLPCAGPSI